MEPEFSANPVHSAPDGPVADEVVDDLVMLERLESDLAEIDRALHALNSTQVQ